MQAIERVPVDSKTDMPRDEVKIVSIDIVDAHDAGRIAVQTPVEYGANVARCSLKFARGRACVCCNLFTLISQILPKSNS